MWYSNDAVGTHRSLSMSLILDALNRSEAERRGGGEVPGLATEHFSGAEGDKFKLRGYLPWLALAVAVAVIAWLLLDRTRGDAGAVVQSAPVVAAIETESSSTPAPAVRQRQDPATPVERQQRPAPQAVVVPKEVVAAAAPADDQATPPERPADATVAALYQRAPGTTGTAAATPAQTNESMADVKAAGAALADSGQTQMTAGRSGSRPRVSEPLDIEAALASARQEVENARLVDHPAPFIQDLSQQRKNAIPTLMYSIHNYSGKAGQSSVMINGKSLRAGANVGKGVKLEEILPESIVLSHQGEQFRLRALNSWVNL